MKISKEFSDFDDEVNISVPYIGVPENKTRLKISDTLQEDFQKLFDEWKPKFAAYIDPNQHTPAVIKAVQDAFAVFQPKMQDLKKMLKSNLEITLIPEDYAALFIHEDAEHRSHIPRPDKAPVNQIIKQDHLTVDVFTSYPEAPHQDDTKLPDDVVKIGRKMAKVAATAAEPDPDAYHSLEAVGNTVYKIIFSEEDAGKKAYLKTCYVNYRGEEGPYSNPLMIPII